MIFHSFEFLIFMVVVCGIYWLLPFRAQNLFLLVASYFFYGFVHQWYLLLIVGMTLSSFLGGWGIVRYPRWRRTFLCVGVGVPCALLFWFKYMGFFVGNVADALRQLGLVHALPALNIALPVGVSFFTFQALAYVIDIWRGEILPTTNLLNYALYKAFFPQLVAGPIERPAALLTQLERPRSFDWVTAPYSLLLIVWGLFKKMVIADSVATVTNRIFSITDASFPLIWAGVFAFGVQIYADFSAYSDIARGSAGLLGIRLMRNFNHPYVALSPSEFWKRWHISLSTWFRDYVYIPLGGSRCGTSRTVRNLMATFLLSGLWHGASWNYVLWGAYHGVLVAGEVVWRSLFPKLTPPRWSWPLQFFSTFLLVHIGWLLFRETEWFYLVRAFSLSPHAAPFADWTFASYLFGLGLVYSLPLWIHAGIARYERGLEGVLNKYPLVKLVVISLLGGFLITLITMFRSPVAGDFIYFQF